MNRSTTMPPVSSLPDAGAATPRPGSGAMFDRVAGRYDLLNRLISLGLDRGWRRRLVAALELDAGPAEPRVLDLATGTAAVALEVARRTPAARVVGLDPSPRMLEIGRRKAARAGLEERVELRSGVAEELPFDDRSFDAVTIAFGIRNVADRGAALAEIARVLGPGGRLAVLEASEPRAGVLAPLVRLHVRHLMPRLGAWLSSAREYRYLQTSMAAFPPPAEFAAMIEDAGLGVLEVEPLGFGACCLYVAEAPR